ncbi:helix-turn-helix domain-containing protein [Streptomyces sp. NPDC054834]
MSGDDFAGLLRELKERSGLSYGTLGKRLHMSASTLHRYVSGDVVPADYAPVERLARVCRATPEELLELHRRWIRADALRGVKTEARTAAEPETEPEAEAEAGAETEPEVPQPQPLESSAEAEPTPVAGTPRRRPAALLAGTGVAAAAAVALVVGLVPGHADGSHGTRGAAANVTSPATASSAARSATPRSPSPSASASGSHTATPSATPSGSHRAADSAGDSSGGADRTGSGAVSVTVAVTPYTWDGPCDQSFLVNRSPGNVPPPPAQQDAAGWVTALGAVAADHQMVALTVQGTGAETVVLQALHVREVRSDAPLTWNKYEMGDGCGGNVSTKSFDVSLDLGNPLVHPVAGQRNFPFKVSESDPEVFYVSGHTTGHDVSWYLELDWSSGSRHGTVRVDDHGKPFRTSGSQQAYYAYPLGGDGWERVSGG